MKGVWSRLQCAVLAFTLALALLGPMAFSPQVLAAPQFDFLPKSGPVGTKVKLDVAGAPSGEDLTVEGKGKGFNGKLCSITTDNHGVGGCSFNVPKVSGNLTLSVSGPHVSHSDIGTFKVTGSEGGGGGNDHNGNNHGGNTNRSNNSPSIDDTVGCGLDLTKLGTSFTRVSFPKGKVGVLAGLTSAVLGCRKFNSQGRTLSPQVDQLITNLGCVGNAVEIGAGLTAETAGTAALLGLTATAIQLGFCANEKLDEAEMAYLRAHGLLPNNVPVEDLGPLPPGPIALPAAEAPDAGSATQPAAQNIQAAEDIRTAVEDRVDVPSAASVRDQQTDIRSQVCVNVPANGAGGCPSGS